MFEIKILKLLFKNIPELQQQQEEKTGSLRLKSFPKEKKMIKFEIP